MQSLNTFAGESKVRGWIKSVALVVAACMVCSDAWAAAALAFDPDTGVIGYGIGDNKKSAKRAALDNAVANGADNPVFWFWFSEPGWGAAAFSDEGGGGWAIGGALGFSTKKKAKRRAKRECREGGGTNCQIVALFKDTVGKSGRETGGSKSKRVFHQTQE